MKLWEITSTSENRIKI